MRQRITDLLSYLNTGVYEKETEIKMALLAAIADESIILLGPPGIAKSMVAHRIVNAKKKQGGEQGCTSKSALRQNARSHLLMDSMVSRRIGT